MIMTYLELLISFLQNSKYGDSPQWKPLSEKRPNTELFPVRIFHTDRK